MTDSKDELIRQLMAKVKILENIVNLVPGNIFWLDQNGFYLGCNTTLAAKIGLPSPEAIVGKRNIDLFSKEISGQLNRANEEAMTSGQKTTLEEFGPRFINGREEAGCFLSEKQPFYDETGKVVGMIGVSLDITDRKERERLELQNADYQGQLKEQGKFQKIASQVAHDIRSPVMSLRMLSEMSKTLPDKERSTLQRIAKRIDDIANNLLSAYRKESDEVKSETILIASLVLRLLTDKRYEYGASSIQFESEWVGEAAFACVEIEESGLKRALSNVINNAVEASPPNGLIKVTVECQGPLVHLTVEDQGKGMRPELLEKIRQEVSLSEGKANGHGIGLSQVREFLKRNAGRFELDSQEGVGTQVKFSFQKQDLPEWMTDQIELTPLDTVVIVDDEVSVHDAWDLRLENFMAEHPGISVHHFVEGERAVEFIVNLSEAQKSRVFLLTDYELSRQALTGLEVIERSGIRHSVLVTSHDDQAELHSKLLTLGTRLLPKWLVPSVGIWVRP